ncbi:MAG: hypothetical protein Q8P89_00380 [bacterium]|nr:hypothetical protein [bacterium]
MGYLVSQYRQLFPQGLFDVPEKIATWGESHRLFARNQLPEKEDHQVLAPGLVLSKGHINFPQGGFSNYQCWEIDPQKRKIEVVCFNEGEFPANVFKKNQGLRFLATLGYFYFTTNPKADEISPPKVKVNNFFIHRGQLLQLPVVNRSAFLVLKNGKVETPFIRAQGTLVIGQRQFNWRGAITQNSDVHDDELVVYNGSAGMIEPYDDPVMGPGRLAKRILTPKCDCLDLTISLKNKRLQIDEVRNDGTEVTHGLAILHGSKSIVGGIKKGEVLSKIIIDGLKVEEISDAVSVGPQIFKDAPKRRKQLQAEGLEDDRALCNRPHREGLKLARAFLAKLKNGNLVSILIDGIPQAGNIYPGVTPQEAADLIFKEYPEAQEVVATDPGGTMKAVYRDKAGNTQVFGNLHYLDYRYKKDGSIDFWPNGYLGRKAVTFLGVS